VARASVAYHALLIDRGLALTVEDGKSEVASKISKVKLLVAEETAPVVRAVLGQGSQSSQKVNRKSSTGHWTRHGKGVVALAVSRTLLHENIPVVRGPKILCPYSDPIGEAAVDLLGIDH